MYKLSSSIPKLLTALAAADLINLATGSDAALLVLAKALEPDRHGDGTGPSRGGDGGGGKAVG